MTSLGRGPKSFNKGRYSQTHLYGKKSVEYSIQKKETQTNQGQNTTFKKLTPGEIKMRRRKNLCFMCDETYQTGHKCKKIFVIVCERDQEET